MIIFANGVVDKRHTVDVKNGLTIASAIQVNANGTYENVTYMTDDERTYDNEVIMDATSKELEEYRKYQRDFKKGDIVQIKRGRKMLNEVKTVKNKFNYETPRRLQ